MGGDDERFFDKKVSDFRVFDKWLPSWSEDFGK
jgi:hypothetical protein